MSRRPPSLRQSLPRWHRAIVGSTVLLLSSLLAGTAGAVELEGTWYVLIHYRDAAAPDPGAWQWSEAVWRFESRAPRLDWTWYPTVLFEDATGRFAMVDRHRMARIEQAWEPNEAQRAEIAAGLRIQPRGVTAKNLRRSGSGFRSAGAPRSSSTSIIGYSESWSIELKEGLPSFVRAAAMGSARTDRLEGTTRFDVESLSDDGRELWGRYRRDGSQLGTFRMWRAGAVRSLDEAPRRARPEPSARLLAARLLGPERHVAALETLAARGDVAALRDEVQRRIELTMRDSGESPQRHAEWLGRLVAEVTRRLAAERESVEAVEALWTEGRLLR